MFRRSLTLLTALLPALALAAPEDDPTSLWLGGQLLGGFQTSPVGDALVAELGARTFGLRVLDRAWVQLFDASLGARTGVLGNQNPYLGFAGGRAAVDVELGYRLASARAWSPFVSARSNASLVVMGHPGLAFSDLDTINASDGFGGVTLDGAARLSGGLSVLEGSSSLLLTGFVQESLRAPRVIAPGAAFTEFGVALRSDGSRTFVFGLEALGGLGATSKHPVLGYQEQSFHLEASGWLRKMFESGLWLGLAVSWGRDSHHQEYPKAQLPSTTYDSIDAPAFSAMLNFGFAPWRTP